MTLNRDKAGKESLEGSPSCDRFRRIHKQAGFPAHYSSDIDLVLVGKHPEPHVVAFVDFKRGYDDVVTFTEAVLYDIMRQHAPVYIIVATVDIMDTPEEAHRFDVYTYEGSVDLEPDVPVIATEPAYEGIPWGGWVQHSGDIEWEQSDVFGLVEWEHELRGRVWE